MPQKSEERLKLEKVLLKHFREHEIETFTFKDIKKLSGKTYDIWLDDAIIRKVLEEYVDEGKIIVNTDEREYTYKYKQHKEIHKIETSRDMTEIEACVKDMKNNLQEVRINISSLNTKYNELPNKIMENLTNAIGTKIVEKIKEELGEFFLDFNKDFLFLKEENKKRNNQLGAIIGTLNEIKKQINVKKRIYGKPF